MNKTIFDKLKQAYSSLGLGDVILQALAESLAATGVVTEENIDAVVAAQKSYLESLQKANDKRVTDAVAKAVEKAKKEANEAQIKALEEAKKNADAEQKAAIEKAIADLRKQYEDNNNGKSEEYQTLLAQINAMKEENTKSLTDLQTSYNEKFEAQLKELQDLKDENARMKQEQAKAAHDALIISVAKQLGIPQFRIDEGFANIAGDADEATIKSTLEVVANNIKTQLLPTNGRNVLDTNTKATDAEIEDIVNQIC